MSDDLSPSLTDLENTTKDIVKIMKTVPDLAKQKVAIIWGLALWSYMLKGRSSEDISPDTIPYISVDGLTAYKIFSCGLRSEVSKSRRDALDAVLLVLDVEQPLRGNGIMAQALPIVNL
ncbi:hypothetical protein F4782DRAFT_534591 [Xylaria castorea]|nr:hypothetical protein F4782DRAFT_534591 [Xylaria castorea]